MPVKIIVDTETKSFDINIGTPPVSQLISKEVSAQQGSSVPNKDKIGNLAMEQVIKIAKMKKDSMLVNNLKSAVKNVVGSANSMGVLVESKKAVDINPDIDAGKYDNLISSEKTEVSQEKLNELNEYLSKVQAAYKAEVEKLKAEEEAKAAEKAAAAEAAAVAGEKKETKEKAPAAEAAAVAGEKKETAKEEAKPAKEKVK